MNKKTFISISFLFGYVFIFLMVYALYNQVLNCDRYSGRFIADKQIMIICLKDRNITDIHETIKHELRHNEFLSMNETEKAKWLNDTENYAYCKK